MLLASGLARPAPAGVREPRADQRCRERYFVFLRLLTYLWPERDLPAPAQADPFDEHPAPREAGPVGVLLVNLGTPASPAPGDIRRYLAEFLSDPRVIEIPRYLWLPILHGLVLVRRPSRLQPRY